jgi:thiamine biosynthesis lipoprotein ApbE
MTRNQAKILKKNENMAKITPISLSTTSKIAEKAIQQTVKETYAEIAKINSLMTKQSDKLDN